MKTDTKTLKKVPFDVHIPNLDGDGIAQTIRIEVEAYTDPASGEDILTPESLVLIEKTQARHMGLMSASEIKELRQRLGLSQDEMSELLQIGGKSYTRWESGRARPSRSMNLLLCALRDGQLDVNYLQALRDPDRPSGWSPREMYQHFFAAWLAQCPKQKMSSPPKLGKSGLLSTWKHYIESTSADFVSISGEVIHVGQVKSSPARTEEEETDTPSAPRLPTSFQQRQTFMRTRFNPNRVDEQNIG